MAAEPDSGVVSGREAPPNHSRVFRVLIALVVLGLATAGVGGFLFLREVNPPGSPGAEVAVKVPHGSSVTRIAAILDEHGVIGSATAFRLYVRVRGNGSFQAGEYTFRRRQGYDAVMARLREGPEIAYERLTVREGLTLKQIAAAVGELSGRSEDRFLELAQSGQVRSKYQPAEVQSLEGLLFPETYLVDEREDEEAILRRLVREFDKVADAAGIADAETTAGLPPYQAIIAASLIERETRFDDERAKVSRVIHNRLERGQLLQVDATVIYALGKSADRNVRVLLSDLEVDSPYNTYTHPGLPPGPIAAPSRPSLEAALQPADGDWLFYVVTETSGRHSFATTNAEHEANIATAKRNGVR
jgi:UPF0755 protein